jgi:hypothetical protein
MEETMIESFRLWFRVGPLAIALGLAGCATAQAPAAQIPGFEVRGKQTSTAPDSTRIGQVFALPPKSEEWTMGDCRLDLDCKLYVGVSSSGLPPSLPADALPCLITVTTLVLTQLEAGNTINWIIRNPVDATGYKFRFSANTGVVIMDNNNVPPGSPRPPASPPIFKQTQTDTTVSKTAIRNVVAKPFIYGVNIEWQPPNEKTSWGKCIELDPLIVNAD